jgi:hypothetical protein
MGQALNRELTTQAPPTAEKVAKRTIRTTKITIASNFSPDLTTVIKPPILAVFTPVI